MKWSRHVLSDIFSHLSIKLSMGFNMQCNKLLNYNKSIPQIAFSHNTKIGTVWLLKTISIPFPVNLVYILLQNTKFSMYFLYYLWSKIVATLRSISKKFPGEFRNWKKPHRPFLCSTSVLFTYTMNV